jgi:membrane protein required for colicin V production
VNWADIAILSVIGISVIISFFRGFLLEALSLLVWVIAFWIAWIFFRDLAPLFAQWVSAPSLQLALAFTVIVIAMLIVGALLTWLVGMLIDKTGLTGTDRVVGLLFGAIRGAVIIAVVVMLAGVTPFPQDPWWKESQLIPHFERVAITLKEMLPQDIGEYLEFSPESEPASEVPEEPLAPVERRGV